MADMKNTIADAAKRGLFTENPLFIQVLGTCPALAVSTSVVNGLGMGASVAVVLVFSNVLISLLRKFIPAQIRIASYIVIISSFVTALEMLLKAYVEVLDKSLGLFIPLIAVNCILLARAEAFASKNGVLASAFDGLFIGLGVMLALFPVSALREMIGAGSFCGIRILPESVPSALMFILPPGAFIVLGCVTAMFRAAISKAFVKGKDGAGR